MAKLQELFDCISDESYKDNYAIAKSTISCVMCGKPARVFRDQSSKLEYDISGLCQLCQDRFLKDS